MIQNGKYMYLIVEVCFLPSGVWLSGYFFLACLKSWEWLESFMLKNELVANFSYIFSDMTGTGIYM